MSLKGSSLRSRRMETCLRRFLVEAARHFVQDEREAVRESYFHLAERIRAREVTADEIVQWGVINDETLAKFPRMQRLLARLSNPALARDTPRSRPTENHSTFSTNSTARSPPRAMMLRAESPNHSNAFQPSRMISPVKTVHPKFGYIPTIASSTPGIAVRTALPFSRAIWRPAR